jgi:hypothetical protein
VDDMVRNMLAYSLIGWSKALAGRTVTVTFSHNGIQV